MVDYLEQLEEERVDILMEQTTRLERAMSRYRGGQMEGALDPSEGDGADPVLEPQLSHPNRQEEILTPEAQRKGGTWGGIDTMGYLVSADPKEVQGVTKPLPLLHQLKEGERAMGAAAQLSGISRAQKEQRADGTSTQNKKGYPMALSRPDSASPLHQVGLEAGSGAREWPSHTGADGPASREGNWAEWADRVFRRDSRRYDGGFYLY